eukprot:scaffold44001_cov59-Phaeocystis_antarctica.AAC.3
MGGNTEQQSRSYTTDQCRPPHKAWHCVLQCHTMQPNYSRVGGGALRTHRAHLPSPSALHTHRAHLPSPGALHTHRTHLTPDHPHRRPHPRQSRQCG